MEKPGAREGQKGTGDMGYKRGTIGQLHDDISFVNLTVSRVRHILIVVFLIKICYQCF